MNTSKRMAQYEKTANRYIDEIFNSLYDNFTDLSMVVEAHGYIGEAYREALRYEPLIDPWDKHTRVRCWRLYGASIVEALNEADDYAHEHREAEKAEMFITWMSDHLTGFVNIEWVGNDVIRLSSWGDGSVSIRFK